MPLGLDKQTIRTSVVLAIAAFLIYVSLIGWQLPYATNADRLVTGAVDELLPLQALAEMHHTFVVSKPDRNYGYPWFHYFALASAQAPYIAYLKLSGQLSSVAVLYPFGFKDPVTVLRNLTLFGRLLSVFMGCGIVIMAYLFSRNLWDHRTGVLAATLTMLSYLQVYFSRVGNPDVGMVFWSGIGLVAFAKILRDGITTRRAVVMGISAGLAMGAKDQAFMVFLPLAIALLFPRINSRSDRSYPIRPLVYAFFAACVSYLASTGMLVDPKRHLLHVYYLAFEPERLTYLPFYRPGLARTWAGAGQMIVQSLKSLSAMISFPVVLAALVGALVELRRAPRYLVLLLPLVVLFLVLTLPTGVVVARYDYPLTFMLDAFAAAALIWFGRHVNRQAMVLLCGVVIGWRALIAADLSYAQFHETRALAGEWLRAEAKPGDRVEFFGADGYMAPLPAEIRSRRIAGRTIWRKEVGHGPYLLQYLKHGDAPRFIYISPDHTVSPDGLERSADCPPEVYQALIDGSAGYRLAARFPTPRLFPSLLKRPPLDHPGISPPVQIFERIAGSVQS